MFACDGCRDCIRDADNSSQTLGILYSFRFAWVLPILARLLLASLNGGYLKSSG